MNSFPCYYPECRTISTTRQCEQCVECNRKRARKGDDGQRFGAHYFCRPHGKCTGKDQHRVINVVRLSPADRTNYELIKKIPFSNLPRPRDYKETKLNVTFTLGKGNIIGIFQVNNYEYGDAILPPIHIPRFYIRNLQCFWVAIAYHLRKWPSLLRCEALCRFRNILPQFDDVFVDSPSSSTTSKRI